MTCQKCKERQERLRDTVRKLRQATADGCVRMNIYQAVDFKLALDDLLLLSREELSEVEG